MTKRIGITVAICAIALVTAASAVAKPGVPPGNSEIDQYVETLPGAEGDGPVGGDDGGSGGSDGGVSGPPVVPPDTASELDSLGPEGQAAADLAEAGAPAQGQGGDAKGGEGAPSRADEVETPSGVSAVVDALDGSGGGLGLLLPLMLVGTLVAAAVFVLARRRSRHAG